MKIGVNDGHTLRGAGTGAVGIIKEGEHTRLVGEEARGNIVGKYYVPSNKKIVIDY